MFILGTVQFGLKYGINNSSGQLQPEEAFRILDYAMKCDIQYLDTAPVYGNAEEIIGKYLEHKKNDCFKIITKFDLKTNRTLNESVEKSLKRLRTENIDTLLFHSFNDFHKGRAELEDLVNEYAAHYNKIGVSVYTNEELAEVIASPLVQVIQLPFNLLDNEYQRGKLLKEAKEKGKQIHVRSVFLQGLFFIDKQNIAPQLRTLVGELEYIDFICNKHGIDITNLAIQYPKSKSYIDGIVFGVESIEQLKSNISCFEKQVPDEVLVLVDDIKTVDPGLLNVSKWNNQ